MCKTENTGTGNGMLGTREIGGMLYSVECRQTFWRMSSNIPGNVAKHSGECCHTFQGMSSSIPGTVLKHSGECHQKIQRIFGNNLWYVVKHYERFRMNVHNSTTGDHELYLYVEELLLIKSTSKQLG